MKDAWKILEIEPTQNKRAIKKAYAKLIAKYHPEDEPETFQMIQEAYQTILDSLNRNYETDTNSAMDFSNEFIQNPPADSTHEQSDTNDYASANVYDDLNLNWSFQNKQVKESTESIYQEPTHTTSSDTIHKHQEVQKELMFQRFEDRLNYTCDIATLQLLILNATFHKYISDPTFYKRIVTLIKLNYAKFDSVAISFLYDVFSYIAQTYGYTEDIPLFIRNQQNKQRKKRRNHNCIVVVGCLLFLIPFTFLMANLRTEDKAKWDQKQRNEEAIEEAAQGIKGHNDEKKAIKRTNVENYMEEQFDETFSCTISEDAKATNQFFHCEDKAGNKVSGHVIYSVEGQILQIDLDK